MLSLHITGGCTGLHALDCDYEYKNRINASGYRIPTLRRKKVGNSCTLARVLLRTPLNHL